MSTLNGVAMEFCRAVASDPEIDNAAARLGTWMIGVAEKMGGFPVELSFRDIGKGFERNGIKVPGIGSRYETIHRAIDRLKDAGWLKEGEGRHIGFGHTSTMFTLDAPHH